MLRSLGPRDWAPSFVPHVTSDHLLPIRPPPEWMGRGVPPNLRVLVCVTEIIIQLLYRAVVNVKRAQNKCSMDVGYGDFHLYLHVPQSALFRCQKFFFPPKCDSFSPNIVFSATQCSTSPIIDIASSSVIKPCFFPETGFTRVPHPIPEIQVHHPGTAAQLASARVTSKVWFSCLPPPEACCDYRHVQGQGMARALLPPHSLSSRMTITSTHTSCSSLPTRWNPSSSGSPSSVLIRTALAETKQV